MPRRPTSSGGPPSKQARAQAREIVSRPPRPPIRPAPGRGRGPGHPRPDRASPPRPRWSSARQAAVEEVTARVGEIVLAAAERVIGREIQAADHQDLIDEAIAAVRAETTDAGAGAGRRPVNPALQGYLAADGGVAGRRSRRSGRCRGRAAPRWPTWSTPAPSSPWPSTTDRCRWRPVGPSSTTSSRGGSAPRCVASSTRRSPWCRPAS